MKITRLAVATVVLLQAQSPAPPTQLPTFRTGVDVVELDVTVLDKDRRPVKGLTADDFIIFDRGVPQTIVAFSAVECRYRFHSPRHGCGRRRLTSYRTSRIGVWSRS